MRPRRSLSTTEVLLLDVILVDFLAVGSSALALLQFVPGHQVGVLHSTSLLLGLINLCSNPTFMTVIALDQYIAIAHPILFHTWRRPQYYVKLSVIIWVSVLVLNLPVFYILITTFVGYFDCLMIYSISTPWKAFLLFTELVLGIMPILVILVCYVSTAKKLVDMGAGKESMRSTKEQGLRTIGATLAVLVTTFAPFHVAQVYVTVADLWDRGDPSLWLYACYVKPYAWILTFFSAFLNPVLYVFRLQRAGWRMRCCPALSSE
ncbi:P2Y purinoceptor 2-like [Narcine bancroftii]|uniref:P2Y purinoceptor 2-like n=1 Tax=Narcine bancroftii TaxID=1343680 RepID=UPI0038313F4F